MGSIAGKQPRPFLNVYAVQRGLALAFSAYNPFLNQMWTFIAEREQGGGRVERFDLDRFGEGNQALKLPFHQIFRGPISTGLKPLDGGNLKQHVHKPGSADADGGEHSDSSDGSAKISRKLLFNKIDSPGDHHHGGREYPQPICRVAPAELPSDNVETEGRENEGSEETEGVHVAQNLHLAASY